MGRPLLIEFWTLSGTGTISFRGRTIVLLLYVSLVFLAFYSKFVTTFPTGSAGRNLTYRFNPVSVVISSFTRKLLRLIRLVFLASLLLLLLTL